MKNLVLVSFMKWERNHKRIPHLCICWCDWWNHFLIPSLVDSFISLYFSIVFVHYYFYSLLKYCSSHIMSCSFLALFMNIYVFFFISVKRKLLWLKMESYFALSMHMLKSKLFFDEVSFLYKNIFLTLIKILWHFWNNEFPVC